MIQVRRTPKPDNNVQHAEADLPSVDDFPPRRVKYPSKKWDFSKFFYRTLLLLFSCLTLGLLAWGYGLLG